MSDSDEATPSPTLAATRSRRENAGKRNLKANKFEALKKLREARDGGRKMNYEEEEIDNVYDIVEESEYAERVTKRKEEDWIVDDDGEYIEDGREIFDDEDVYHHQDTEKKYKERSKEKAEKVKKDKSNIKNMLLNMPKKQSEEVKIENDELLGDILGQIKTKPSGTGVKRTVQSTQARESPAAERNPFKMKGTGLKKTVVVPKATPVASNFEPEPDADMDIPDTLEDDFAEEMEFEEENVVSNAGDDVAKVKDESEEMTQTTTTQSRGFTQMVEKSLGSGDTWLSSGQTQAPVTQDVNIDLSQLPTVTSDQGEEVLRMYWIDAFEDPYKHPGTVWLFGKVWVEQAKQWVSSCVTVKNIPRRVFFAQREYFTNTKTGDVDEDRPVGNMDLYNEINDKITKRYSIKEFKCRPCEKMYAFEHSDIPDTCQYLEVMYDSKYPSLPPDLKGETFSRVFGAPQTSLEWFLLEQKIKGPGWLDIKCPAPSSPPVSWCKMEAIVTDPDNVTVSSCSDDPPPFVTLSLKLGTVINSKTLQNEVAMVGCLAHTSFSLSAPNQVTFNQHYCLLSKPADEAWPYDWTTKGAPELQGKIKVEKAGSERELLSLLLLKIQKLDPDFIIGHDVSTFDLEVLIHRMQYNKIPHWSRLGRLRRSNQQGGKLIERNVTVGRLVADLKISAKELIRCKSYELGALVEKCLDSTKLDEIRPKLTPDFVRAAYLSSENLKSAINFCMRDADDALSLMIQLQALPLALQISQIAGTVFSRTLRGGRAERIEYLLLHAFTQLGYILPDKQIGKKKVEEDNEDGEGAAGKGKKKASYAGGLVLDPKKGFYDKFILLLDFNSLYPSIIQEYNICFTTVDRTKKERTADGEMVLPSLPDPGLQTGVLPAQIKKLVDSRREVKNILKKSDGSLTEAQKSQLNIRQLALKLTANSMYGCLGFSYSRFFAKHLAALVTSKGREILLNTRDLIQKMNLDVIYGDTDSVMVNTNSNDYEEVFKLGREVKQAVNKLYRLLELDIDGVFRYMLLLKKKKYAAMTIEKAKDGTLKFAKELKGLDIVRRDWCQLAADAGKAVIDIIMTDKAEDTRLSEIQEHLESLKTALHEGKVALKDLEITKQLTKDPSDYPDKKSLAHVQVAMRLNSGGGKKLRAGDTVEYVICDDGSGLSATQRAYAVEEVKTNTNLKIDTLYYLSQQLHPVVSRLCDPIEGMDSARVALCLGLDPTQYKSRIVREDSQEEEAEVRDEDKFRSCERLTVSCVCGDPVTLDTPVTGSGKDLSPALLVCPRAKSCGGCPANKEEYISNCMEILIRKSINKYYQGWLVCEDPGCTGKTRVMPLQFQRAYPVCPLCKVSSMYQEYSAAQLYTQILYVYNLFDTAKMSKDETLKNKLDRFSNSNGSNAYDTLRNLVDQKYMQKNGYSTVSLCKLFDGLFPSTTTPGQA